MSEIGLQGACGGPISMHDDCFCTELNITGTVELKAILAFHVSALLDNATTSSLNVFETLLGGIFSTKMTIFFAH